MKKLSFAFLLACIAAIPFSNPLRVEGPVGSIAPLDTLRYTLRWGRATNATGYQVTVTAVATNTQSGPVGLTLGLPTRVTVLDTVYSFMAINLAYDSLAFTASVTSMRGTRTNPTPSVATWSVVKRPGVPGPIIVDSTAIPPITFNDLDLHLQPRNFAWATRDTLERVTVHACAFMKFSDGTVAMRSQDERHCMYSYRTAYAPVSRGVCTRQTPLWDAAKNLLQADHRCAPLSNSRVQSWADAQCFLLSSSNSVKVRVETPVCPVAGTKLIAGHPIGVSQVKVALAGIVDSVSVGWK